MALKAPANAPTVSPRLVWLAVAGVIAVTAVLAATAYGRGMLPPETRDPGALVRWGYGIAQTLHNTAAAATIGALVFAASIIPPAVRSPGRRMPGGKERTVLRHRSIRHSPASWCWPRRPARSGHCPPWPF